MGFSTVGMELSKNMSNAKSIIEYNLWYYHIAINIDKDKKKENDVRKNRYQNLHHFPNKVQILGPGPYQVCTGQV